MKMEHLEEENLWRRQLNQWWPGTGGWERGPTASGREGAFGGRGNVLQLERGDSGTALQIDGKSSCFHFKRANLKIRKGCLNGS